MTDNPSQLRLLPSVPAPIPYGAHIVGESTQFTLFSRHATRVWLMLFDSPDAAQPDAEFELQPDTHRIGDLWHIRLHGVQEGQFYLYRLEGQAPEGMTNFFNPEQWVLDPYALAVSGSPRWGDAWDLQPGEKPKNGPKFPKGVIVRDDFDWTGDRAPRVSLADTIVYEVHLRGFTAHPSSGVAHPGTYAGFTEKLPYLQELGVTAVEFLPIHEFNEMEYYMENMARRKLRNYWGYSTVAFFAPNARYAAGGVHGQQVREFKELVCALHHAGIEVFLDVVFNHTAEGAAGGPVYSFRGIDNAIYYMMEEDGYHYRNYTGCGNTVNCNHPIVRDFIVDCLRYWVLNMHVDGFRFDLASVLTRGPNGEVLPNPSVVEHIAEDPALRDTKLIAEAWDAAGLYQVGSFPNEHWSEWNGRYRDEVRQFWRGDPGLLGPLTQRLLGSPDLYQRDNLVPQKSINFITCHDGFTLNDLVSYNKKHNEANRENNRDGDDHNNSYNYGQEGPTKDGHVRAVRKRQMKNMLATMMLSQGVPMILGGDEMAHTQHGNNNAYCQDTEQSWLDWSLLEAHADLHAFVKELIAFRKAHPGLRQTRFLTVSGADGQPDLQWFGPDGGEPKWNDGQGIAFLLRAQKGQGASLFAAFNAADQPQTFQLPEPPAGAWKFALWTTEKRPAKPGKDRSVAVEARAVLVLTSAPRKR